MEKAAFRKIIPVSPVRELRPGTANGATGRSPGCVFVEFSGPPTVDLLDVLDAGRCVRAGDAVYLDAVAMAAWIAHPDFHVVK
ncbi:hypothetical protein Q3W71_22400 [Micromonospora sp. C28SCA-DRY-2]|uniref:hypothetical protein n=1 Tax=Micromonospora sp. C28SCA-DRY-2 TaxID=3059522 RepID=UPI0026744F0B|nr:hypothetical protein [Micromonospora sp. C28SCA-DRY-2]MDO3704419.1 hypothetical protein [Micromonospora sp. C28SCA-DRY-2]